MTEMISIKQNESFLFRHCRDENPPLNLYEIHTHRFYELIYILDGDVTHAVEDKRYNLRRGDLVIIRPFQSHRIEINSNAKYERYNVLFDGEAFGIANDFLPPRLDVIHLKKGETIYENFKRLNVYSSIMPDDFFFDVAPSLVKEIFFNITSSKESFEFNEASTVSPVLSTALAYISENLNTVKDISEISNAVFITESYLYRLFKNELRTSPKKYILQKRLLYADSLILSGRRPTEIFAECGFGDYATFYRNYVAAFGHSPSERDKRKISFLD